MMTPSLSTHTFSSGLVHSIAVNAWLPLCRPTDLTKKSVYNINFLDKSMSVCKTDKQHDQSDQSTQFNVFDDRCPHRGAKLSHGDFDGDCVSCPYHAMKFSVEDGGCRGFLGNYDLP